MRILTAYFARRCYSLMILLLFPNLIAVVQGQIKRCPFPGCGKPLSLCAYKGKHPAPKPKERHILFSVNRDDASALLYIDGIPKDSIYYGYNGRRGYDLKYGSHQVLVAAPDVEDSVETIKVDENSQQWYVFSLGNRSFAGKSASQIKSIGDFYFNGTYGRRKNVEEAYAWYEKAAEMGHDSAQYLLGQRLIQRRWIATKDVETAVDLFRASAVQGNRDAQYSMGDVYEIGDGVEKNYTEALKWYRMAAEQGHTRAIFCVGYIYYQGRGMLQRNYKEAMKWFLKIDDDAQAQNFIGYMYQKGYGVWQSVDSARVWFLKSANQGYADAQYHLGDSYYNNSVSGNVEIPQGRKGKKSKGQNSGHLHIYVSKPDYPNALKWYTKAAEQNHPAAQKCLAGMYLHGQGMNHKDTIQAVEWYRKAVANYGLKKEHTDAYKTLKENLLPLSKAMYIKSPAMNRNSYANDMGLLAYEAIFQKQFTEAEKSAREGLAADDSLHWIQTNLAAALLFQGKYAEAESVYTHWKNELRDAFLADFRDFEKAGIIAQEQEEEVEKIKGLLSGR
ncbi:MAG: SEL1-like repeat protein [Prevotella sp.]|nr:SEL1-like repeat protein [Prevotella sp.]